MELNKVKVGDWVIIVNSGENWTYGMNKFASKTVQVTSIEPSTRYEGEIIIEFEGSGSYNWTSHDKHFIICGENYSIWS